MTQLQLGLSDGILDVRSREVSTSRLEVNGDVCLEPFDPFDSGCWRGDSSLAELSIHKSAFEVGTEELSSLTKNWAPLIVTIVTNHTRNPSRNG